MTAVLLFLWRLRFLLRFRFSSNITIYKNFITFDSEIKALKFVESALNFININREKTKAFIFQDEDYSSTIELSFLVHRIIKKLIENKENP